MTAPQIIAAAAIVVTVAAQMYGLWATAQQVRATYYGRFIGKVFVRVAWPHMVNVAGMLAWTGLLTWGGFWG